MNSILGYSLAVAAGGALGATLRYWAGLLLSPWSEHWPWHTFFVNCVGSLLMGIGLVFFSSGKAELTWLKLFFLTGCLGSFTTFSTFSVETLALLKKGQSIEAIGYILMSVVLCISSAAIGSYTMHRVLSN